jgi:hypothetical protein
MDLKEFISLTLCEIQQGVQDAIEKTRAAGTNGVINPCWGTSRDIGPSQIQQVQFDIALTVADKSTAGAEAGIKVWGINLGGSGSSAAETSHVSRIQFSIPVVPPITNVMHQ